jgi:hypothetical protein
VKFGEVKMNGHRGLLGNNSSTQGLIELINRNKQRISQTFIDFLDREINISRDLRIEASKSQLHLREIIATEHDRDVSFPIMLKEEGRDFLGGSFARHTKILPLDDIDIYFPIDGAGLTFTESATGEVYSVVTDNTIVENPLLGSKWTQDFDSSKISSSKLINGWARLLKGRYPNSKVKANGQAISVYLSSVAVQSEEDPGLGFDVVPCFLIRPTGRDVDNFYIIADGKNGWIRTNPKRDQAIAELLHDLHDRTFRPVVKLVKYWNSTYLNGHLNSYFIELVIAKAYMGRNSNKVTSIQEGLALAFSVLAKSLNPITAQSPWVNYAPAVQAGDVTQTDSLRVLLTASKASEALADEKNFKFENALEKWTEIFPELIGE